MVFRDQKLVCKECGRTFFFTVSEQRDLAKELGAEGIEPPSLCSACCRGAQPPTVRQPTAQAVPTPKAEPATRERIVERQTTAVGGGDEFPLEEEGFEVKLIGTVKWFSREKGYGFITKADGQDLFFHRTDISDRQGAWPEEDQQVEFQIRQTPKGQEAFNVSILPED